MSEQAKRPAGFRTRKHCGDLDDQLHYEAEQDDAWRDLQRLARLRAHAYHGAALVLLKDVPTSDMAEADYTRLLLQLLRGDIGQGG